MSRTGIDFSALEGIGAKIIAGRWYRTVKYKHRGQVDSPEGSARVEGRYHTTEEDRVLYLSDSPSLSMNESARIFMTVPIEESAWYTAAFAVELSRVLDLTDSVAQHALGIEPAHLVQTGLGAYSLPQEIARQARSRGFEAMRTPSARSGQSGSNLVVFLEVVEESGGTVAPFEPGETASRTSS